MGTRVVVKKAQENLRATDAEIEAAVKTFKRKVNRDGVLQDCKKREYYIKPGVARRLKHENALKARKKLKKKD